MLHRRINIILIIVSIVFLMVFLGFWLHKSYMEAKEGLKNELEVSLSKINQEVNDSQLKNIFMFVTDTMMNVQVHNKTNLISDNNFKSAITIRNFDTIPDRIHRREGFQLVIDSQRPALIDSINIHSKFGFRAKNDSAVITELFAFKTENIEKIDSAWRVRLLQAGLPGEFRIRQVDPEQKSDSLHILVREKDFFSENEYQAFFSNYNIYLLKKIFPQISISFLLLTSILAAFYFIYKSLLEQEKLGKLKNDFISNMTHELKTPISTVGVAIEALQKFDALSSPEKTREYLGIAGSELNRLTILVDKVLKMSQFDSGKSPLGKVTVHDFKEILENVSTSMKLQLEKFNASLELDIEDGNFQVEGDKIHLANIIYNLLDNALKYGGDKPSVKVKLVNAVDHILLTVKDQGLGIAKEYQDKIFDQFFRVPKGNLHDIKGYGLGLSYVANVVNAHGGKISLKSEENQGAEFIIELPKYA